MPLSSKTNLETVFRFSFAESFLRRDLFSFDLFVEVIQISGLSTIDHEPPVANKFFLKYKNNKALRSTQEQFGRQMLIH